MQMDSRAQSRKSGRDLTAAGRGRKKRTASAKRPPWKGGRWRWMRALRRRVRALRRAPGVGQIIGGLLILVGLSSAGNWIYQVVRKPSEVFFPVSGALFKNPSGTRRSYDPIFR